jgi:hypothetical protein
MSRRVLIAVVGSLLGLLIGGLVGLAAGAVAGLNALRPHLLVRWMIVPLFAAMALATLLQGRLVQDLGFSEERPLANQIGLALIVTVAVLVLEAIIPVRLQAEGVGDDSSDDDESSADANFDDEPELLSAEDGPDDLPELIDTDPVDEQSSRAGDGMS